MSDRTLDQYQYGTSRTAVYPDAGDTESVVGIAYTSLGLSGEAGEVANKVKKMMRDNDGVIGEAHRTDLAAELGDCLWYIAQTATQLGYSLSSIAEMNLNKLASRADRGALQGSGDNR